MPFGVGPLEIVIIMVILLIVVGPSQLPRVSRALGSGAREVKDAVSLSLREERPPAAHAPRPAPDEGDRAA